MGVVAEESDETVFWLELLVDTGIVPRKRLEALLREANELLYIFSASRRTARLNHQITKSPNHQTTGGQHVDSQIRS